MSSGIKEAGTNICKERSLRSLPVHAPSLVISHGGKYQHQTFCVPSDKSYYGKSVPEMRGMSCDVCCCGWLLLQSYYSRECYLFNPVTLNKIHLPLMPNDTYDLAVMTSPPSDLDCLILYFSNMDNSCIFCRIGDTTWTKQEVECRNKDDKVIRRYLSAVSCKEKIYLFYNNGVTAVDVRDAFALIEPYEIRTPCPSLPTSGVRTSRFLESRGEIYQVCRICLGMSTMIVQHFDVFKLDLSTMDWVKVESLGGMIFLVGASYSVSVSPSVFGAKGNCIYFFADQRTNLYCFDMDDNTIKIIQPCPTKFTKWGGPYWVVPDCKMQVKREVAVVEVTENKVYKEEWGQWKDLQVDHLELILQSLVLRDCIRFRLVCKPWMTMKPLSRPFNLLTQSDPQHLPWLISLANNKNDVCHFYHPIYTDSYVMNIPQLEGAFVLHANFGWLLLTKAINSSIFFFNPFTKETITLPEIEEESFYCLENISFSAPPTSSDCIVFGLGQGRVHRVYMLAYRKHENRWISYYYEVPYAFIPSHCNPVFHGGVFYSLSKDGMLGVFNPSGEDKWRVYLDLSVPDVNSSSAGSIALDSSRSYITESDGDIFAVFMGYLGKPVSVYKLYKSEKKVKWIKVQSLGNRVMFVSHTTSLLIPAKLKGTENRIYLPRFKKNASVFYSLTSGSYHSFGEDSQADWIDTCEHWNCTWLLTN
ncbi:hypothetical protein ACHQM5_011394 [Ranunculus cassubicifolius]